MQRKLFHFHIKYLTSIICAIIAGAFFCLNTVAAPSKKGMVVVIDPGHGGEIPGAIGRIAVEKEIVLDVAKKVGTVLGKTHPDIEIVYTRAKDIAMDLADRSSLANKVSADLFISIHANAGGEKNACGTETWVMGLDKTEKNMEVAMKENAEVVYEDGYETKYEGYNPNSPESFIMFSFMQNTHMEQSLHFASLVEQEFTDRAKRKSRGVKQGPFLVLWRTNMPSVLIEIGFISNRDEEKYIASEKGQTELAEAIAHAIGEYKKRWDRNNGRVATAAPATALEVAARKPEQPAASELKQGTGAPTLPEAATPANTDGKLAYHVQIFASSRLLKDDAAVFKGLKDVSYYRSGNIFRYYVGKCDNEAEAAELLREVRTKFPEAFTIKLRDGKPE